MKKFFFCFLLFFVKSYGMSVTHYESSLCRLSTASSGSSGDDHAHVFDGEKSRLLVVESEPSDLSAFCVAHNVRLLIQNVLEAEGGLRQRALLAAHHLGLGLVLGVLENEGKSCEQSFEMAQEALSLICDASDPAVFGRLPSLRCGRGVVSSFLGALSGPELVSLAQSYKKWFSSLFLESYACPERAEHALVDGFLPYVVAAFFVLRGCSYQGVSGRSVSSILKGGEDCFEWARSLLSSAPKYPSVPDSLSTMMLQANREPVASLDRKAEFLQGRGDVLVSSGLVQVKGCLAPVAEWLVKESFKSTAEDSTRRIKFLNVFLGALENHLRYGFFVQGSLIPVLEEVRFSEKPFDKVISLLLQSDLPEGLAPDDLRAKGMWAKWSERFVDSARNRHLALMSLVEPNMSSGFASYQVDEFVEHLNCLLWLLALTCECKLRGCEISSDLPDMIDKEACAKEINTYIARKRARSMCGRYLDGHPESVPQ